MSSNEKVIELLETIIKIINTQPLNVSDIHIKGLAQKVLIWFQKELDATRTALADAKAAITYLRRQLSSAEYRAIWEEVEQIMKEGGK